MIYDMEHELRMHALSTKLLEANAHRAKLVRVSKKHQKTKAQIDELCIELDIYKKRSTKARDDMIQSLAAM